MPTTALTNYRPVRYSHIRIEPGESHTLTADPWAYLYSHLLRAGKYRKGKNRLNNERAIFYADLANSFYRAADVSELPAQATLLYYGMLNLVKCFLSVRGVALETRIEHHGATLPFTDPPSIQIAARDNTSVHILSEFSQQLGKGSTIREVISLKELFSNVTELHGLYCGIFSKEKPKFLHVDIQFCTNNSKRQLFTEISYEKKNELLIATNRLIRGNRAGYFLPSEDRGTRVIHQSERVRYPTNWKNIKRAYNAFLKEFADFSVTSMLTRNGYQYYVNLDDPRYHHLSYSLMAMFHLGSAARYRPTMMQKLMDGEMRPLITEAAALCPRQFQYNMVSLITGKLCAVPFAAID